MKTKHVGLRLGVAFAILIALLVGIGKFGLRRMQTIDKSLSDITGSKSTDLDLARRALTISNDNNRIVMEIVLVENRRLVEPLLAARSQNSKEITELIEESENRCTSVKEKQLLSEVRRTRQPYLESCQRAIHLLVEERKHDEAETVLVNETLPALHTYHAAWQQFVKFQKDELAAAVKQAQDDHVKAQRVVSLLIVLAVVLAVVIALFATRGTAHEMAARIDAEKEVSKLNAGLEERVIQRTSELSETIKHLVSRKLLTHRSRDPSTSGPTVPTNNAPALGQELSRDVSHSPAIQQEPVAQKIGQQPAHTNEIVQGFGLGL